MTPKIFYLAQTPLDKRSGATLAMRRHFLEHNDMNVFVATSEEAGAEGASECLKIDRPRWLARAGRTRIARFVRNFEILVHSRFLQSRVLNAALTFKPDAIFTVADLTLSEQARVLARHLGVPLITNFQDWWPRGQFYLGLERPFPALVPHLEKRFRELHRQSDLVFCTSEGMRDHLGTHPNSHVLYPIGAQDRSSPENEPRGLFCASGQPRRLLYTGTAFGSYGRMLLELSRVIHQVPGWELVVYGARPDWPADEIVRAEKSGLYRGFLPFEKLKVELASADACLSVMSFDPELEVMMRTSFTTKVLDYCSAGRPVIMWGPAFCSPVKLTKRKQSALTVETADPSGVLECLLRISSEPGLAEALGRSAAQLAREELSHEAIHGTFVREIQRLLSPRMKESPSA